MNLLKLSLLALCGTSALGFTTGPSFLRPAVVSRPRTKAMPRTSPLQMVADDANVCLITGASRGLGKSMALELAKHGQIIIVNYIKPEEESAMETVEEIKAAGGDAIALCADCSDQAQIKEMFEQAIEKLGRVDVLVNNAGITKDGLVLRMKPEEWQAVINLNLSGVFYCTQAFFKYASKARKGRIINIASVVGLIGNPGQANYAAAKGGVIGLTRSNAKEFSSRNVTVNAICPGFIATPMTKKLSEDYLKQVADSIPLKRLGTPEEVAGLCRYLALDPSAGYMTGHTFNMDGGIAIGT